MKTNNKYISLRLFFSLWLLVGLVAFSFGAPKKVRVRTSLQYKKVIDGHSSLVINSKAKGENGYHPVDGLKFTVYQLFGDSSVVLGNVITSEKGAAIFEINQLNYQDTSGMMVYKIVNDETENYKSGKKQIEIQDIDIDASLQQKDSTNYIYAQAKNPTNGQSLAKVPLTVSVQRIFKSLPLGKGVYRTDDDGTILVPIPNDLPGIDGMLTLEIKIDDSDDYGTVETSLDAKVGVPIVTSDTFDQRTMWSPPSKTPLYMLIWPNLIILGIWGTLFVLMFNLFRIYKSVK